MTPATYRTRFTAKAFCAILLVLTALALWVMLRDRDWPMTGFFLFLFLVAIWGILLCFTTTITLDETHIHFDAAHLLPTCKLKWEEIGKVKLDLGSGTGDAPGVDMYEIVPRNRYIRKRIWIGPWIARYKQLLREVLERVPTETEIHPHIVRLVQKSGESSLQQAARAILSKQRSRHSS